MHRNNKNTCKSYKIHIRKYVHLDTYHLLCIFLFFIMGSSCTHFLRYPVLSLGLTRAVFSRWKWQLFPPSFFNETVGFTHPKRQPLFLVGHTRYPTVQEQLHSTRVVALFALPKLSLFSCFCNATTQNRILKLNEALIENRKTFLSVQNAR